MPSIPFTKMHGLGNDFIVIDGLSVHHEKFLDQKKTLTPEFARKVCDRRYGIGADQILWLKPPKTKKAVAVMEVINADGTKAEMCGNGIRAVALYLDRGNQGKKTPSNGSKASKPKSKSSKVYPIETGAGLLLVEVSGDDVRVDMGPPKLGQTLEKLDVGSKVVSFREVSMGNPHAVILVSDLKNYPAEIEGPAIEKNARFPKRTNVEFVEVMKAGAKKGTGKIKVRVWERGAGFTLACGTGACASAVVAIAAGKVQSPVEVELPGGSLLIEWSGDPRHSVFMSGPAEEVFRGAITS
jgi:diaminopimelate epimerase